MAATLKRSILQTGVAATHSDFEQTQREEVMRDFKNGHIDIQLRRMSWRAASTSTTFNWLSTRHSSMIPEDYVHRIDVLGCMAQTVKVLPSPRIAR